MSHLSGRLLRHFGVLAGFILVAVAFTWPLAANLQTHLPGPTDGDTGVYVWNLWVFHHEVTIHRTLPYFTDTIFAATGRANLSLHNYTPFANLLALPFVEPLGVVATFNLVYLALLVLAAYSMFLLARRLTGDTCIAWLAGVLFAWSPALVTRGMGHFSLVAAAPLPIFVLVLLQMGERRDTRSALALGATVAWATACDVYYGVFCVMLAVAYLTVSGARVTLSRPARTPRRILFTRALDVVAICLAGLVLALVIGRGWEFVLLGQAVRIRTLYTPVLVLTLLVALRIVLQVHPVVRSISPAQLAAAVRVLAGTAVVAATLMSPLLFAFGARLLEHRTVSTALFWRSSPPGVDLVALVSPNPNHPLAPAALREWIAGLTRDGYLENVASIPLVGVATLLVAMRFGWRADPLLGAITLGFGLLALGPFVRIAGIQTYVPGPWALLRYVPIVGLVRSPTRFLIFAMVGAAALFATAVWVLVGRWPAARRTILAGLAAGLLIELLPAPRPLFPARVPSIYQIIASDARDHVRVLELPFGIRDGTMTWGSFTTRTQFYQTAHHKPILGGYLSRVSQRRIRDNERDPVLGTLLRLADGTRLSDADLDILRGQWPAFVRRASVGYVVVDGDRGSPALQALVDALPLERLAADGSLTLYRPAPPVLKPPKPL